MSTDPLLHVEDVFDIQAFGGPVVVPGPLVDDYDGPRRGPATLVRPDGSTYACEFRIERMSQTPPPKELRWVCILTGVEKADVPIGTDLFIDGGEATQ